MINPLYSVLTAHYRMAHRQSLQVVGGDQNIVKRRINKFKNSLLSFHSTLYHEIACKIHRLKKLLIIYSSGGQTMTMNNNITADHVNM